MRFFPPAIQIGDDEGFTREKDIFSRAAFAKGLTNLVSASEDPLVILLDSAWGKGKTTFIKMWASELRKLDFSVIYFDAFENDHVDNGFVAIAAEVIGLSKKLKKTKGNAHKNFLKKAGRLGGILLRTGARLGVKAATLGAIDAADIEALKTVADDVAKETSTTADQYVESILKLQSQEKQSLEELRISLAALADSLADSKSGESTERRPLVFIIDELDRCKPSFALELIERIKHIFSIPNVHFVLSTQLGQLENSVRFSYGNDIDALTYLQKFYNVIVHFPDSGGRRRDGLVSRFISHLNNTMSVDKDALQIVGRLAEIRGYSFRTIERIATCIALARSFVPRNHLWISAIISVLCVMKIVAPEMFRRARDGKITLAEIQAFVGSNTDKSEGDMDSVVAWWKYCFSSHEQARTDPELHPYRQYLFSYSLDPEDIVPAMARYLDSFQPPS